MHRIQVDIVLQQEPDESGHVPPHPRATENCVRVPGGCCQGTPVHQDHIVISRLDEGIADLLGTAPLAPWRLLREPVQVEDCRVAAIEIGPGQTVLVLDVESLGLLRVGLGVEQELDVFDLPNGATIRTSSSRLRGVDDL